MQLDCNELEKVMKALGYNCSKNDLNRLVKQVDFDGSGFLELEEFMTLVEKMASN